MPERPDWYFPADWYFPGRYIVVDRPSEHQVAVRRLLQKNFPDYSGAQIETLLHADRVIVARGLSYWQARTIVKQLTAAKISCAIDFSCAPEDLSCSSSIRELNWQVRQVGSQTSIDLHGTHKFLWRSRRFSRRLTLDNDSETLSVDDRMMVPLPSVRTVWLRGSNFENVQLLGWTVGLTVNLSDMSIVATVPDCEDSIRSLAQTLSAMLRMKFVERPVQVGWGSW